MNKEKLIIYLENRKKEYLMNTPENKTEIIVYFEKYKLLKLILDLIKEGEFE